MSWIVAACVAAIGGGLLIWARHRIRAMVPVREAAAGSRIGELVAGRFRVTGRVVKIRTSASAIDQAPCVFIERAEYRTLVSELVPILREVGRHLASHPFYLDDGTGRVRVDPSDAIVDAGVTWADEGLLAERRVCVGEELELVARFESREEEHCVGPYRTSARSWHAVADAVGPPRLSPRAPQFVVSPSDDVSALLRGLGFSLLVVSAGIVTVAAL